MINRMSKQIIVGLVIIIIAIISSGYIITTYLLQTSTTTPVQELKIGLPTSISTIDIHFAKAVADFEVLGKIYESLFKIDVDESGKLVYRPWLIERFIELNNTTYLLILKNNVKFHNGKVMDAWDVKASIERSMSYGPIGKILLRDARGEPLIDRIEVINKSALIIKLRKPFAFLPEHLAHLSIAIMPSDIAKKYMGRPINSTSDVIGTGPYKLIEYEPGNRIILEVFNEYWGHRYTIKRVIYRIITDVTARLTALFNGDIDIAIGITPDMVSGIVTRGFRVLNVTGTRLVIVAINVNSIPDVRVRQALNYAVDKKAIVDNILKGYGAIAQWVVPPIFPDVVTQKPYEYSPDKAKHLLLEAGFKLSKPLRFLVSTRSPKDIEVAEAVQNYLKNINVSVEIMPLEHNAFLEKVFREHDFDLALYGPSPSSLYYGLSYWRTGAALNGPNYSNPEFDNLLDKAAVELNPISRSRILAEAQEILWRDSPAIWLYVENLIYAINPRIEGVKTILSYIDLRNVYVKG